MNTKEIQNEIKATENRLKVLRESIEDANKLKYGYHKGEKLEAPEGYEIAPENDEIGPDAKFFDEIFDRWRDSEIDPYTKTPGSICRPPRTYARPIKAKPGEVWSFDGHDAQPTLLFDAGFVHLGSDAGVGYTQGDFKEYFASRADKRLGTHSEVYVLRSEVEKEYISKKELSKELSKSSMRCDSGVDTRLKFITKFGISY